MYQVICVSGPFLYRMWSSMSRACPSDLIFWEGRHIYLIKHVIEPEIWIIWSQFLALLDTFGRFGIQKYCKDYIYLVILYNFGSITCLQPIAEPKARIKILLFWAVFEELPISRSVLHRLTWNIASSSGIIHVQLVIETNLKIYYVVHLSAFEAHYAMKSN